MAQQIARIRRLIPDDYWPITCLTLWDLYELAVEYLLADERGLEPKGADAYLAFAPWRDLGEVMRYEDAVRKGSIEPRLYPLKDFYEAEKARKEWVVKVEALRDSGRDTAEQELEELARQKELEELNKQKEAENDETRK